EDLPMPKGIDDPFGGIDLPGPGAAPDLPAPKPKAAFGSGFDDDPFGGIDLPSPAAAPDLPAPKPKAAFGSGFDDDPFGGIDLPTPSGAVDLPTPANIVGLPAPAGTVDLPTPASILDLPEPAMGVTGLPRRSHHPPPPASGTGRVAGSGSTDYGEIDLGSSEAEFDAFPTRASSDGRPATELGDAHASAFELADDPHAGRRGSVIDEDVRTPEEKEAARRSGVKFEGRRRWERQKRVVRIVLLVLLALIALVGGSLSFTPLGPFGANAIARLLPSAAEDAVVGQTAEKIARRVGADTVRDIDDAISELELAQKELKDSEDLRLLGTFLHNWRQIRFGDDSRHSEAATRLLGAINPEQSPSRFAQVAMASKDLLGLKVAKVIQDLSRLPAPSPDALALLAEAHLSEGRGDKARDAAKKLAAAEKNSLRARFLEARAIAVSGQSREAMELLRKIADGNPGHHDAVLLEATLATEGKIPDPADIRARLGRVIDAGAGTFTAGQKARAHALAGRLFLTERHYTKAASEFDRAEELDPKDLVMLVGRGTIALTNDDLSSAAGYFVRARAEHPGDLLAALGQAETAIRQGGFGEAKGTLTDLVAKHPDHPRVHYLLGLVEAALKNAESAEKSLGQAIALDKDYLDAYVALADLYLKQGRDAEALRTLDEARGESAGSPLINMALAEAHTARGDHRKAAAELQAAIRLDPKNARAQFRLAQSFRKQGMFEEATRALDDAAVIDSNLPGLALEHGLLLEQTGKVQRALAAYEKALAANPADAGARIRVGAASFLLGRYDRAQELLEQAVAEDPGSADTNFYLGEVMRARGQIAEAVGYLKAAVKLDEANALHHVRLAAALMAARNMSEASRELERALELDPELAEVYLRIGESKLRAGAARDAIASLDKALSLDPRLSEAYALAGEAFEELADLRAAQAYFRRAVREIPDNGALYFKLALVELQVAGTRAAAASLTQATRLGDREERPPPWLPEAYYRYGTTLLTLGQRAQAKAAFERYLEIAPETAIDRPAVQAQLETL
ncbi:MAG TPA: tetratricopeptide repeat protein, partial [Polyangia bacterium]|nr:tetratricopeptide repeat protein [Polyangia bacterium]